MTSGENQPDPEIEIEDMLDLIGDSEFRLQVDNTNELLEYASPEDATIIIGDLEDEFGTFYNDRVVSFVGLAHESKRENGPYKQVFTEISRGWLEGIFPIKIEGKAQAMLRINEYNPVTNKKHVYHVKPIIDSIISLEAEVEDLVDEEIDQFQDFRHIAQKSKAFITSKEFRAMCIQDQIEHLNKFLDEVDEITECFEGIAPHIDMQTGVYIVASDQIVDSHADEEVSCIRFKNQQASEPSTWHTPTGGEMNAIYPELQGDEPNVPLEKEDFEVSRGVPHIELRDVTRGIVYWIPIDQIENIGLRHNT